MYFCGVGNNATIDLFRDTVVFVDNLNISVTKVGWVPVHKAVIPVYNGKILDESNKTVALLSKSFGPINPATIPLSSVIVAGYMSSPI